jgi:hypothetical protein
MIILKLFIGLFVAWLFGYLIVSFFDSKKNLYLIENIALSHLLGQGLISLLMFFLFLLPITNRPMITILIVLILLAVKILFSLSNGTSNLDALRKKIGLLSPVARLNSFRRSLINRQSLIAMILLLVIVTLLFCKISYVFIETCSKPEYAWDAAGNWLESGKNYFYAEQFKPDKILVELKKCPVGYPRGLSIMHYWLFAWMGTVNDQCSKIIFPLEFLCLLIIVYYNLKPIRGELGAIAFVYLLASTPFFIYHATIGYADFTRTTYFAVGIIYFYRWLRTRQNSFFWFFAIPVTLTTWIKIDSKIHYVIGLVLLLFYLWRNCQEPLKNKIIYIGNYCLLFVLIGLPWQLFVSLNQLLDLQHVEIGFISYDRIIFVHREMYNMMYIEGSWGVFWMMVTVGLLCFFKRQITKENIYLLITILLFYGGLLSIFLLTFLNYGINGVFNRVLLPLYPIVVFNLGCVLPSLSVNKNIKV